MGEVTDDVINSHAVEVVNLTTAQDGSQELVLLRRGKDEDGMAGWFFQCLEKSIERLCGKHVYLVDDEHLILAYLRRNAYLLNQLADVIHRVV